MGYPYTPNAKTWPTSRIKKLIRAYATGKTWGELQFEFETPVNTLQSLYYTCPEARVIRKRWKIPKQVRQPDHWTDERLDGLITLHAVERKTFKQCAAILGRPLSGLLAAYSSKRSRAIRKKRGLLRLKWRLTVLVGKRFGRLKVLKRLKGHKYTKWLCRCTCGRTTESFSTNLIRGKSTSCGKHRYRGWTSDLKANLRKEYRRFRWMHLRCADMKNPNYGGKGIRVCERWSLTQQGFENYAADMGKRPRGKSLDRINVDKGYSKDNCRWATDKQQANNKTSNVWYKEKMADVFDDAAENPFEA